PHRPGGQDAGRALVIAGAKPVRSLDETPPPPPFPPSFRRMRHPRPFAEGERSRTRGGPVGLRLVAGWRGGGGGLSHGHGRFAARALCGRGEDHVSAEGGGGGRWSPPDLGPGRDRDSAAALDPADGGD